MQEQQNIHLNKLGIYQKSITVFQLSRQIVSYLTNDKDVMSLHTSKEDIDIYADRLIVNSLGLIPKIVETENEKDIALKLKLAKSFKDSVNYLKNDCSQLTQLNTSGKDFLELLQKELKKLQVEHHSYVNSIIEA